MTVLTNQILENSLRGTEGWAKAMAITTHIEDKELGRKLTKRELKHFVEQDILIINK